MDPRRRHLIHCSPELRKLASQLRRIGLLHSRRHPEIPRIDPPILWRLHGLVAGMLFPGPPPFLAPSPFFFSPPVPGPAALPFGASAPSSRVFTLSPR